MQKKLSWKWSGSSVFFTLFPLICLALTLGGCATDSTSILNEMKKVTPIMSIKDYEVLLAGDLNAEYVGNGKCLKKCHEHKKIALDFRASTMGDQLKQASGGMMLVDCESCHGPGSLAIDTIEEQGLTVEKDRTKIKELMKSNFQKWKSFPAGAKSYICLRCHAQNATFNIHNWNGSAHAMNDVTCSNCHPVHKGADLITAPKEIMKMCLKCHKAVQAQFSLPSHHPLKEQKMFCNDCHDPHGAGNPKLMRRMTVKETCGRCHTEKMGPYTFEHADVTEKCTTCHANHGSINDNLLVARQGMLCSRCHREHPSTDVGATKLFKVMVFTRCSDCHNWNHGTDKPGPERYPFSRTQ